MFPEIWLLRYVVTLVLKNTGSISPSKFDEKLSNILVTFLYPNGLVIGQFFLCVRGLRVVAVALFQGTKGVSYFLVWWRSKFYNRRGKFPNSGWWGHELYMTILNLWWKLLLLGNWFPQVCEVLWCYGSNNTLRALERIQGRGCYFGCIFIRGNF